MPSPNVKTAETLQPLSQSERDKLDELLARASAGQGPGVRIGKAYVALTNLSVPRRGDPEHGVDLVRPGEVVHLTDDEAAQFMRHGARDGRQLSVIAPADGPEARSLDARPIPPRAFSGRLTAPPADARPDPAGSSAVQVMETAPVPEASEPQPGTENSGAPAPAAVDAEDIIPSRVRQRQASRG